MTNLSCSFCSRARKTEIQLVRKLFFKNFQKISTFFCGDGGRRQILGFGAVCRLADSVVLGILRKFGKGSEDSLVSASFRFCQWERKSSSQAIFGGNGF